MIDKRNNSVLHSIISSYIETAQPVGSKLISERLLKTESIHASPATIRNTMAKLEEEGFIEKRHCSAGRVPTAKAFRLYVDEILTSSDMLTNGEMNLPENLTSLNSSGKNPVNVLHDAAHILSELTHNSGIVITETKEFIIKHIRLFQVDREQVMLVALSTEDETFSRATYIGRSKTKLNFEAMSNYLNILGGGLTLRKLKNKILKEIKEDKLKYDKLVSKTLELSSTALVGVENVFTRRLLLDSTANIFDQPEYSADISKIKMLHKAFEEKNMILELLDKEILENKTTVLIGSESGIEELSGLSFITTPCTSGGDSATTLGVIGPMRMNYQSIIPLVYQTAKLIKQ